VKKRKTEKPGDWRKAAYADGDLGGDHGKGKQQRADGFSENSSRSGKTGRRAGDDEEGDVNPWGHKGVWGTTGETLVKGIRFH